MSDLSVTTVDVARMDELDKTAVLQNLRTRAEILEAAREQYEKALYEAKQANIPNTVIARVLGVSEAGIRMFFKRRELKLSKEQTGV